jgi:nucleotide-binding universal stress UspA family protein
MEQVLCVIDFSPATAGVLAVAVELASRFSKPLTILYPYRILPGQGPITDYRKGVLQKAQQSFAELEQKLHLNGSLRYEFRAEIGFPGDRVAAYFEQQGISLVVIGEKMATEKNEAGVSGLEELMGRVPVPILVVPENTESLAVALKLLKG